jgi:hypothetical protein
MVSFIQKCIFSIFIITCTNFRNYQLAAKPLENLDIAAASNPSLQLYTMHCCPNAFDKSFVVSVLPVPAGPSGVVHHHHQTKPYIYTW